MKMKKLILFILAAGALTTTFAQSRHDRDYAQERILGSSNSHNIYGESNRRYDARIYEVKSSRWLRKSEKRCQVRALEAQRTMELSRIANPHNNRNNDYYHDRYAKNNRRY
jgi:hypothetical protein